MNEMITAPQVRLIGVEKEPLGIVAIAEALRMADEAELDLVEISPLADPPVCRIMDIGKFKYAESKKLHEAKLKQKQVQIKEIKFRPNTDEGDYNIKLRNLIKFLDEGDKTKVTLRFRGREMAHQEIGMRLIERHQIPVQPPDRDALDRTYTALKAIHGSAHEWDPPDVEGLERLPSNRMRQYVRAWINEWDLRRLDPSYRPSTTSSEIHLDFSEAAELEGEAEPS